MMPLRMPRRAGMLLATGQTTQYSGEPDDGDEERGLRKRYEILTLGQYAGMSNIDLIHVTAATISFAATTPGTIEDSGNALAMFKTGETIVISGSASNDGVYEVSTGNVAGTIRTTEATLLEAAGATVSIAKRELLPNACVQDLNTGRMWARYTSAENAVMGTGGDGKMPWTGFLYDIFQYVAAANTALLGGHDDWRVPNRNELINLIDAELDPATPDTTAFPLWPNSGIWTSTTFKTNNALAWVVNRGSSGDIRPVDAKTTITWWCALVRGGT